MARTAVERSALYRLLAAVFREEPSEAFLLDLSDAGVSEALAAVGVGSPSSLVPRETLPDGLAVERSRLFTGPGPHVPLYESVHLGGEGGSLLGARDGGRQAIRRGLGFRLRHGLSRLARSRQRGARAHGSSDEHGGGRLAGRRAGQGG